MDRIPASSALRSLKVLGDAWTLRVLRDAFRGTRRFSSWHRNIGLPRAVLSDRLGKLTDAGVLRKWAPEDAPGRPEYWLTECGLDLWTVLLSMWAWEVKWDPDPSQQRMRMIHKRCGHEAMPVSCCSACGENITPFDTEAKPGPGAGQERADPGRVPRRSESARGRLGESMVGMQNAYIHGDRWNASLVAAAFKGARRFGDFEAQLHIAPNILSTRLAELVEMGIFERRPYQDNPPRHEYRLTEKGRDIFPVTLELIRWGDRWLTTRAGPPVIVIHKPCGAPLVPQLRCSACHEPLDRRDIELLQVEATQPARRAGRPRARVSHAT